MYLESEDTMGWGCTAKAHDILELWAKACIYNSGSSNVWRHKGKEYFFEVSSREHGDGAITGVILRNIDANRCRKVASFRINSDGSIARAPKFLMVAAGVPHRCCH